MKNSKELREDKGRLIAELQDMKSQAVKEKRELTPDEWTKFNKINDDVTELDQKIRSVEKLEKIEAEKAKEPEIVQERKLLYTDVFNKLIRSMDGVSALTADERSLLSGKITSEDLPASLRAQSTTTTAGGYTIPEGFISTIEKTLLFYNPMMDIATIINSNTGNDLPMPTNDDTSNVGALLGENTVVSEQDTTFGQITFKAYKIYSKLVKVSVELLQDNAVNFQQYLAEILGERIGRSLSAYLTTGTGSSQPQGFVTGASNSSISGFAVDSITRDNIIDLIYSVDRAYRSSPKFRLAMHDSTMAAIRKLAFGSADDRPLYQAGNAATGEPDMVDGVKVLINNDMAELGASAKSLVAGDFSKFTIRQSLPSSLFIFNERYMDYLQKAFMTYGRWDSKVMNSSAIKYAQNSAT